MSKREKLLIWVEQQHKGQFIRKTNTPYVHHLISVANMADVVHLGYEVGLCHDLLEKSKTSISYLRETLIKLDYEKQVESRIVDSIIELTNVYTKNDYPVLRKSIRKKKEADRMAAISPLAQPVKYADLIYNIGWMRDHEHKHLQKYLQEKKALLEIMDKGDNTLRIKAKNFIGSILSDNENKSVIR
jgi:(p)ppGpp synthase/HD superfamily hydrolase